MGHHEMSTATENVLVALTGLSGAVVIAALVTRFIPTRSDRADRHSAIALFEGLLIAVTIMSAILTAESSLVAIHEHRELSSGVLSHIALPLVFGVVLLTILAMASRLAYSSRDGWSMLPVFVAVVYVAAASALAIDLNLSPSLLWTYVAVVLAGGALIAIVCRQYEVASARHIERVRRHAAVVRRADGCHKEERELAVGLPGTHGSGLKISCTTKGENVLLDERDARQLEGRVGGRWREHAEGRMVLPPSGPILSELRVRYPRWRPWKLRLDVRIDDGASKVVPISIALQGGYFDITSLAIVSRDRATS